MSQRNYRRFTDTWLSRAERSNSDVVDEADKFISLWIAFNGWMREEFGEDETDRTLLDNVIKCFKMERVFLRLKESNCEFYDNLRRLEMYKVLDMRDPDDENRTVKYEETFESLLNTIYAVRCNLFHGRKTDKDKTDFELICLSYNILLPLFKTYLRT